jgi:hypothetical protein
MVKFADHPEFIVDLTPQQIFNQGAMSGCYFRPVYSNVTKKYYKDDYKQYKCLRGVPKEKLDNGKWDNSLNKYNVNASLSLSYWETHNWIHPTSIRGWISWYCGFYDGKRTVDDRRQISRFMGVLIRFGQRKNKTPRVLQALHHWGIDGKKDHTEYIKKIKGLPKIKSALN